jgi:hypothetical protein
MLVLRVCVCVCVLVLASGKGVDLRAGDDAGP